MAISPIGNVTYINQNSQANATQQANAIGRNDGINILNKEFEDKLKDIEEVRPTEDSKALDPDKQGGDGGAYQKESKNSKKDNNPEQPPAKSDHILDIKV